MNAVCPKLAAALALFILFSGPLIAQYSPSKFEVGASVGTLVYQGDLANGKLGNYQLLKPSATIWGSYSFDQYFALRGNLAVGGLSADESKQSFPDYKQHRNFSFSTPVAELSALLVWTPAGQATDSRFSYYFTGGIGASFLSITRNFTNLDLAYFDVKDPAIVGLPLDIAHRTPRVIPVLPLGAGVKYALNENWSLNTEFIYRLTATDYLDGFKYAANPKKRDSYYGLTVGVSYKLGGNRYRCPKMQ